MATTPITPEPNGPLTPEQQQEVWAARQRTQKIRKAAGVANFNGWVTGIIAVCSAISAVCSAPFALFSPLFVLPGLFVTAVLSVVAYNEFRGRKRLLQFEPEAASFLGWNQIGFLTLIICYCAWMLIGDLMSEDPIAAELNARPELGAIFESVHGITVEGIDGLYRIVLVGFYGTIIVLSGIFQGLNALYYFTRRKHVEAYVHDTPDWVLDLLRLTSST